ncbi:MAG: DsbA family protein [Alphaproteobacteria bacterium]|nr:DsbA family protein [Alphaproteobacteria bacterium]
MRPVTPFAAALALAAATILPACSEAGPESTAQAADAPSAAEAVAAAPEAPDPNAPYAGDKDALVGYLVEHPDVLHAAVDAYQTKLTAEAVSELAKVPGVHAQGPDDAPITIVEFFDYHCGYCKRALDPVLAMLKDSKDIHMVFAEFPILVEESSVASRAALAAERQGKYLEMHQALMRAEGRLNDERIEKIAKTVGLDVEKLKKDMADPEVDAAIQSFHHIAGALGVNGTPSFLVNGELVVGWDEEHVKELVEKARKDRDS